MVGGEAVCGCQVGLGSGVKLCVGEVGLELSLVRDGRMDGGCCRELLLLSEVVVMPKLASDASRCPTLIPSPAPIPPWSCR